MASSTDDSQTTADNVQDVRVKLKRHRPPRVSSKIKPGDVLVNILKKVMTLATKAASVLGFRVLPTSILVFVAYAAIFLSLTITDILPKAPTLEKQRGLDLDQAYEDLHHIAAKPHPYISHANDNVRAYILSRLLPLAEKYPHVHISSDLSSNASWFSPVSVGRFGVYFEGTNVLVKVDGTSDSEGAHEMGKGNREGEGKGAVLFSAHYDSVSTATGATDDGMGVVTLLQLVQYFAERRSVRTAVFNVNNGEEDGLHGAHAFLEHPWSDLTETFLNLEGAAAGGRPILFRATTTSPVRSFRNKRLIPHPHANVLSSDAFSRGLIRSSTDFSVYSGSSAGSRSTSNSNSGNPRGGMHTEGRAEGRAGMQGLDLAFYKGRAWYHTKYDAVQHTVGGKDSLWSMLEVARGVASGLLDEPFASVLDNFDEEPKDDGDDPVYFDLFKARIVVFQLATLLTFNIVLLIAGPVVLILLSVVKRNFLSRRDQERARDQDQDRDRIVQAEEEVPRRSESIQRNAVGVSSNDGPPLRYITRSRTRDAGASSSGSASAGVAIHVEEPTGAGSEVIEDDILSGQQSYEDEESWAQTIWRHAKFWVALLGALGMQVLLMWCYVLVNPFAMYSSPYAILFSFMSLSYLVMVFVLALPLPLPLPQSKSHPSHIHSNDQHQKQKQTTFIHLYILTYLLLVLATLGITKLNPGVGGGYVVSAWNLCVGVGCFLGGVERVFEGVLGVGWKVYEREREGYEELRGAEPQADRDAEVDERTPLIQGQRGARRRDRGGRVGHDEEGGASASGLATWWWIPQFLVSVPFPVILLGHIAMLLLDSVPQTLTDGADPWGVYSLTLLLSITLILPLAPFAYKLRPGRLLTYLVLTVFLTTTIYALLAFPFSSHAPIKVYFQQRVEFPSTARYEPSEPSLRPRVFTAITGPERYLLPDIVRSLPSAEGKEASCKAESTKPGLVTCEWETGPRMWPSPGSYVPSPVDVDVLPHQRQQGQGQGMPNGSSKSEWKRGEVMKAQAVRTGPVSAVISVKGRNTRACRVYFDEVPVERYVIWPDGGASLGLGGDDGVWESGTEQRQRRSAQFAVHSTEMQDGYEIGPQGVESLRLWSRTWEREFRVEIQWKKTKNATDTDTKTPGNGMKGRIACEWSEYESGLVDNGALYEPQEARMPFARVEVNGTGTDTGTGAPLLDEDRPRIPAFEEVLTFLPEWATVSKFSDGLVEASVPFAV